jgi:hypothetical protein
MNASGLFDDILTEIHSYDEDGLWLVAEYGRPANNGDIKKHWDFTFDELREFLKQYEYGMNRSKIGLSSERLAVMDEDTNIYNIISMVNSSDIQTNDIFKNSSWGVTNDGELKMIDYGLGKDVFSTHYGG